MIIEVEGNTLTELLDNLLKQLKVANIVKICELNEKKDDSKVILKNLKYKGSLEEIFKKLLEDLLLLGNFCLVNLKIEKVKKIYNTNAFVIKLLFVLSMNEKNSEKKYWLKNLEFFVNKGKKFLILELESFK